MWLVLEAQKELGLHILPGVRSRSAGRCVPDVQGICYKKKFFWKIQKLELVLKFLVFFLLSTNNILTFVEDFKSIPVPSKEISSLEVEKIFEFLTLLSFPLVVLLCHTRYDLVWHKRTTRGNDNKVNISEICSTAKLDISLLGTGIDLKSSTNVRILLVLSGENTKNFKTSFSFCIFRKSFFL